MHIAPTYAIITNIDREHMDFYKSLKDLKDYFIDFVNKPMTKIPSLYYYQLKKRLK